MATPASSARRSILPGLLAIFAVAAPVLATSAQTHRVAAPQKVTRAVAVYEWTGDLAKPASARLIPVSIYIDGGFHNAGTFDSQPIPMALLTGNVYSLERAGVALGTIDLDFARHLTAGAGAGDGSTNVADAGWFGYGTFVPLAAEKPTHLQPSTSPASITTNTDDGPPSIKPPPNASKPARNASRTTTPPSVTPSPGSTPEDDPDRPTLHRHASPAESQPGIDPAKPGQASVTAPAGSLADDPDRPTMQRGKPQGASAPPPMKGIPTELHQVAAVSDAATADSHLFARAWDSPVEQAATLAELQRLAQPLVESYVRAHLAGGNAGTTSPATAHAHTRARTSTPKPPPAAVTLSEEQVSGYTLSYGGLPTFVYSAIVPAVDAVSPARPEVYVTLIAQRLPSGGLQPALTSITDANHLDSAPWMRLVDAVDPDSEHRASLLFELRAQSSRQFALYRILSAQAEQLFVTEPVR